jgi:glucosamine--fructose-6-phosphate aminotransferase (isomerizing)
MCGIIGYVGKKEAYGILLNGLKRLEYRGYDSAGIGVIDPKGKLLLNKAVGRVDKLQSKGKELKGSIQDGQRMESPLLRTPILILIVQGR